MALKLKFFIKEIKNKLNRSRSLGSKVKLVHKKMAEVEQDGAGVMVSQKVQCFGRKKNAVAVALVRAAKNQT